MVAPFDVFEDDAAGPMWVPSILLLIVSERQNLML
jgi:hypothetical protein